MTKTLRLSNAAPLAATLVLGLLTLLVMPSLAGAQILDQTQLSTTTNGTGGTVATSTGGTVATSTGGTVATTTVPGVPETGAGDATMTVLLLGAAAILIVAGLLWLYSRRGAVERE